ncbi:MAG TPA: NAD-binding protein [Methylomirabilota bacterium]|nr:NAD-binding protein [Methylomirabilota bacterium]
MSSRPRLPWISRLKAPCCGDLSDRRFDVLQRAGLNAVLVRYAPDWIGAARLSAARRAEPAAGPPDEARPGHVVSCGFGRVGSAVGEALETFDIRYEVIERDPDIAGDLRTRGVPCLFGDAAHGELLRLAGADRAALVVVALPEIERARLAVRALRVLNPQLPILARAHGRAEAEGLRKDGATEVIQPELEASVTLIGHTLRTLAVPNERVAEYLARFRDAMGIARLEFDGAGGLPGVREVTLRAGGLTDLTLREAQVRERFGVTVVAIHRPDGVILNPPPDTILHAGDRVRVFFGLPDQIAAFRADAEPRP